MISPTPWELSPEGDIIFDGAGFPVAIKPTFSGASGDMRLMECAPRLMAALRDLLVAIGGEDSTDIWCSDARALLAEIEGG